VETITVHADEFEFLTIPCPSCGVSKILPAAKFKDKKHQFIVRCRCEHRFKVRLNFRKHFRKIVKLMGEVMILSPRISAWKEITVCNLSMNGIRFKIIDGTAVEKGDRLQVRFTLDNKQRSLIEKKVCVRAVSGEGCLRCEFAGSAAEEKELGFYLFT